MIRKQRGGMQVVCTIKPVMLLLEDAAESPFMFDPPNIPDAVPGPSGLNRPSEVSL